MKKYIISHLICLVFFISCQNEKKETTQQKAPVAKLPKIATPEFNQDSAFVYLKQQVAFGPRVPSSKAHANCSQFLENKLKSLGATVLVQKAEVSTFDNKKHILNNIIASYKAQQKNRILLCAHWDTRPFADRDKKDVDKPIDGADDGASGVAVLLEIARQINLSKPNVGIDFVFFDIEDYGQPSSAFPQKENTWCLGSQYWAGKPHQPGYYAKFGVLLDMVGSKNATFCKEGNSAYYAASYQDKIWNTAARLGYGNYFLNTPANAITDDHYYINTMLAIPTVDIINMNPETNDFGPYHHKHADNMSVIDSNTLKAVGQTILEVIYSEN